MRFSCASIFSAQRFFSFLTGCMMLCIMAMTLTLPGCAEEKPKVNKKNAKKYYDAGFQYEGAGKYKEALENYNKAIKENPSYKKAYMARAILHENQGRTEKAIKDFEKIAKLDKKDTYPVEQLARIYRSMGQQSKSEEYEREASKRRDVKMSQTRSNADQIKKEKEKKRK